MRNEWKRVMMEDPKSMEKREHFSKLSVGLIFKYTKWNSSESKADPMEYLFMFTAL